MARLAVTLPATPPQIPRNLGISICGVDGISVWGGDRFWGVAGVVRREQLSVGSGRPYSGTDA